MTTVLLDPFVPLDLGAPTPSAPPADEDGLHYRLDILATDVAEVVHAAGGWLYDRAASGWRVNVFLPPTADSRPLQILGVASRPAAEFLAMPVGHGLAVSATAFAGDPRVRDRVQAALDSVRTTVTLWGDPWPMPVQRTLQTAHYRLSAAARRFKGYALAAAGAAQHPVETIEAFLSDLGPCLAVAPDLVSAGGWDA